MEDLKIDDNKTPNLILQNMEKEPQIQNKTYEFIGRLALVLFCQNIKISYATLIKILKDNGMDSYGNERGMAQGISAAYCYWENIEQNCRIPTTCGAIANTFVNREGYPSWLNY